LAGSTEVQGTLSAAVWRKAPAGAFGLTGPGPGSRAWRVAICAVREGDEYLIYGTKSFITNGGIAGLYTVFCTVDRQKGLKALHYPYL